MVLCTCLTRKNVGTLLPSRTKAILKGDVISADKSFEKVVVSNISYVHPYKLEMIQFHEHIFEMGRSSTKYPPQI